LVLFLSLACLLLGTISVAQAAITVTSLNDSGPGTLRQAIANAASGDTINFAVTGTITLTSGELAISNNLTIAGPGMANLTVNGRGASRVFEITISTVNATLSDLTIANGVNSSYGGGGIKNIGTLTLSHCAITNCLGGVYGAGIYNSGNLNCMGAIISGNDADFGGGILNDPSSANAVILNSTLSGNTAGDGGGIENDGQMTVTNTTFYGNTASDTGGAIRHSGYYGGTLTLNNCTVSGNKVTGLGAVGGIANVLNGRCTIISSTLVGNMGGNSAGGVYGPVNLGNSIVAGNTSHLNYPDCNGAVNSLDYNFIQNTNGAAITNLTTHNIYGKDPLLGPLADNGGPTMTHALLSGSPAIDHGSSGGVTTDQRGQPRPVRFPAYLAPGDGSDIGAYELQERAQTNWVVSGSSSSLVFIVNSTNDVDDGVPGIAHCSLREAINAANAAPGTNTTMITFATNVPGISTGVTGTITLTNGQLGIYNNVNINGPGMTNLTVSGNNTNRVFAVINVPGATISGLKIANGFCTFAGGNNGNGGGIYNSASSLTVSNCAVSNNKSFSGGGIGNSSGKMTLISTLVSSNATLNGSGGGIGNDGMSQIFNCAVLNNISSGSGGGISSAGMLAITNSTISGNLSGTIGTGNGGGIATGSTNFIVSCTICSNYASGASARGGGLYKQDNLPSNVKIQNSIVAGNIADYNGNDCFGTFDSQDYNLIQNTLYGTFTNLTTHNIYNQDPKLGPLAYLGGPTPTHPLRYDSPAMNAGNSGGLTTDQRGFPRPIGTPAVAGGDGSDTGAYEADPNLRLTAIAKSGNDILLNFPTVFGRTYEIDAKNNLSGSWTMVSNNIPGSGGIMQAVESGGAGQPQRFYRAEQQ